VNGRGVLALILEVGFLGVALVARVVVHRSRTGDWGVRLQRHDLVARLCGALFVAAIVVGVVGAVLAATGATGLVESFDGWGGAAVGVGVFVVGAGLTFMAQYAMGESWRIGVDPDERTELVAAGPFRFARNPVFTGMIVAAVGLALTAPTAITVGATLLLVIAIEVQVRAVEEPYLRTAMSGWSEYASDVGRFVRRVGRIRTAMSADSPSR
jgi:protein-S-isoprenylcysteine O-methyltransferase Ste14